MNVLYIGALTPGTTSRDRMVALQEIGHEVTGLDVVKYYAKYRIARSIQWRLNPKIMLANFNRDIVALFKTRADFELIWIDKGVWVFPETLISMKAISAVPIVHYSPDFHVLFNRSPHLLGSLKLYDHVITTKTPELALLEQLGGRHVVFATQSYCRHRWANPIRSQEFDAEIGFVGRSEAHYRKTIRSLSSSGLGVRVWGDQWSSRTAFGGVRRDVVAGRGVFGDRYVNALASFRIGLGLLSKLFPEQHTTRSVEIPAAGTFLLAERTGEHSAMFSEGQEAEFFESPDEMVSKARFYLANESQRNQIAIRGQARCVSSGYDNTSTMRRILRELSR